MADDTLIEETTTPASTPSVSKADFDSFGDKVSKTLGDFAKEVTASVAQMRQASTSQPVEPTASKGDNFLDEFVNDGKGTISKVVQEALRDTMGPWVQSQVSATADNLRDTHRTQVDKTYGAGTFDEVVGPEMEKILATLDPQTQAVARGNKQTFEAILKQARGDDAVMEKLAERREAVRKAPPEMLGDSRTPSKKTGLSTEDNEFLQDYERAGRKVDRKALLELIEHKRKHGAWAVQDLGGKNRLPL